MKKAWSTPEVNRFGSFAELTEASTNCGPDSPPGKLPHPGDDSCLNTTCGRGNCEEDGGGGVLS